MKIKGKILGRATELTITEEQYEKLLRCTTGQGGNQSLCQRVYDGVIQRDGKRIARVYTADMERIKTAVQRPDKGTWQDVFREIMSANNMLS